MKAEIYQAYATEIVNTIAAIGPQAVPDKTDTAWTRKIKEEIGRIGKKHDFRICASGFDGEADAEWLYDMIWYSNNQNNRLESVPLVLESEWALNYDDIRFDFEKLLLANSPVKVMIFQNYGDTVQQIFEKLQCGISEYIFGAPSIYILACYRWDTKAFEIMQIRSQLYKAVELVPRPSIQQTEVKLATT